MSMGGNKDIGALASSSRLHLASISNADNGVAQDGASLDTQEALTDGRAQSRRTAELVIDVSASLTAAATLDLVINLQHAPDDGAGSPGAFVDVPAGTLLGASDLGPGDLLADALAQIVQGTNDDQQYNIGPVDLSRLERHVRVQITPTFSAADSAIIDADFVFGGTQLRPADLS